MTTNELLCVPDLEDLDKYLQGGTRTPIIEKAREKASDLHNLDDVTIVKELLVWMHKHTERIQSPKDERKFKRSSLEILSSGIRTGCCDSCTLFTSLARSAGIPTMQILTFDKEWGDSLQTKKHKPTAGHFYAGVYLRRQMEDS